MVGDLRKKLEPLGRLDVLDEAGTKVLDYYAALDLSQLAPEELARNAQALSQLGEVRVAQGKLADAAQAFAKSLELANAASARKPGDPGLRLAVGTAHYWVGFAAQRGGDQQKALAEWRAYLAIAEELSTQYPSNEEYELERAYGHGNVGVVLEAEGKLDEALGHYRTSLEIKQKRLDRDPKKAALRSDVAASLNKVGVVLTRLGEVTAARDALEREVAIRKALSDEDPTHMRRRDLYATALDQLALAQTAGGDLETAMKNVDAEGAIRRELARHDAENVQWLHHLGVAEMKRGTIGYLRGDSAGAAAALLDARKSLAGALGKDPDRPVWRDELAQVDIALARVKLRRGDSRGALQTVDGAIVALAALEGQTAKVALSLGEARLARGEALASLGRTAEAAEEWRLAEALLA